MKKNVLLIGGRSKAKSLALSLLKRGYHVTVINGNYADCLQPATVRGIRVINGDGTKPFILDEAGAAECDISIALTAKDEDNLIASELCKHRFGVKKTVSIVSDSRMTDFFIRMGVDSVVCANSVITSIIEQQAFIDEMANIIPLGNGRAQVAEVQIPDEAPAAGKKVWELSLPQEVIIGCILRGDKTLIPRGDTRIHGGDTLVVISGSNSRTAALEELLGR